MQRKIPATFMRGGTSKGIFFSGQDLKQYSQELQEKIFLRAIGSPDPYQNHMDGLGGATSSTSKIAIINPSQREDCDIDYNFGAVPINDTKIDFSGNCGNLSAAAGVFAIEQNMIKKDLHSDFKGQGNEEIEIKIYQKNIKQKMSTIIKCKDGYPLVDGNFKMAGLNNLGSEIMVKLQFDPLDKENLILPTNNPIDIIEYKDKNNNLKKIESTLVNVGNPTVFIRSQDIQDLDGTCIKLENKDILEELEQIRCIGGYLMGLGESPEQIHQKRPATPKIAFLTKGGIDITSPTGEIIKSENYDFNARILSMGKLHHAFTATGAISLVAGAGIKGTIVSEFLNKDIQQNKVDLNFAHRSGVMDISSEIFYDQKQSIWKVLNVGFLRSARSIMQGSVLIPESVFLN